jgi:hypothetical protein
LQDEEELELSEGFWKEFFLLKPDRAALRQLLHDISPSDMLMLESRTRELFARAIEALKDGQHAAPKNSLDVNFTRLPYDLMWKADMPRHCPSSCLAFCRRNTPIRALRSLQYLLA